jgi:hypothetical protein
MPTEGGDTRDDGRAIDAALGEALEDLSGGLPPPGLDAVDYRWLRVGMLLGLERPERARTLLALIEAQDDARAALGDGESVSASPDGGHNAGDAHGTPSIPVASALLARAAALAPAARVSAGPEVAFGWAAGLAPDEIVQMGEVVGEMLGAGSPPDIGRGFGITWTDGVRIPRLDLDAMVKEFAELEITVGGILAGRDLRTGVPAPKPQGIVGWLSDWGPRTRPEESQAAEAIERSGEAGRRGLVALWNVWMAMRYRALISRPTFDLMAHPWVTVIGPLPE